MESKPPTELRWEVVRVALTSGFSRKQIYFQHIGLKTSDFSRKIIQHCAEGPL